MSNIRTGRPHVMFPSTHHLYGLNALRIIEMFMPAWRHFIFSTLWLSLLTSPSPSPKFKSQVQKRKGNMNSGLSIKSYGPPPTSPLNKFKRVWVGVITPECHEGVPSHFRWTARWRTWSSSTCSRRTLSYTVRICRPTDLTLWPLSVITHHNLGNQVPGSVMTS